jgi:hypothetical protein
MRWVLGLGNSTEDLMRDEKELPGDLDGTSYYAGGIFAVPRVYGCKLKSPADRVREPSGSRGRAHGSRH